jgi:hypothetical protein
MKRFCAIASLALFGWCTAQSKDGTTTKSEWFVADMEAEKGGSIWGIAEPMEPRNGSGFGRDQIKRCPTRGNPSEEALPYS